MGARTGRDALGKSALLPDNRQYTKSFRQVRNLVIVKYIVAQHRSERWWSCGCLGNFSDVV